MPTLPAPFALWPEGRPRAVTFSYDDGQIHDRRVVEILDRHGLKGTFNLNSGNLGRDGFVSAAELPALYRGHEVATHTVTHPFPVALADDLLVREYADDRLRLEAATGRIVRGHAYPFGDYDARVRSLLARLGIDYARTVRSHGGFRLPADWLEWHPTCHDKDADAALAERFLASRWPQVDNLLYVWGHSYEFEQQGRWASFEAFCAALAARSGEFWAATNGEIFAYRQAVDRLRWSADGSRVENPSARPVWLVVGEKTVVIPAGETATLPA